MLIFGKRNTDFVCVGLHQTLNLNCECLNQNHTEKRLWKLDCIKVLCQSSLHPDNLYFKMWAISKFLKSDTQAFLLV